MEQNKKTPQVRFKEYNDTWEQRKLGEIGKASSGIGFPDSEQGGKEGVPFYKVSDMNLEGNEIEMTVSNNYVTGEQIDRKKWSPLNDVPAMYFAKVGAAVMLNRKRLCRFPFLFDNNTMAYSLNKEYWDTNFAKAEFAKIDLTKLVQVGALPSYNVSDVESIKIMIPSLTEQAKIGEYFSNLDHLINLYQCKYDKLINVKKAMLEKMFPKNGSLYPEIRFGGFTGAWEQRKLNEITDVRDGTHDSPKYVQEGHPFITSKNVSNGFINYGDVQYVTDEDYEAINKRSKVDIHDILMGMIGTIGNLALISKEPDFAIKNVALIKYTGNVDYQYLYQALQTNCVTSQLSTGMDGGTQKFVSLKKVRELDIPFPKEQEQQKIGAYFCNLDNLITLHQRKLEKLKNMKKSCLEKMFV